MNLRTAAIVAIFSCVLLAPRFAFSANNKLTVEQVEAEGMENFGPSELQSALELTVGDEYDEARARRSVDNLTELYHYKGYPNTKVKASFDPLKGLWSISVSEGSPVRIRSVVIEPTAGSADGNEKSWRSLEGELLSRFGIYSGDIFDQEKASISARLLQSLLLSEEYIGGAVNEVRVERGVQAPADGALPRSKRGLPSAGWVDLRIRIDVGEKVSFGFRGNRAFSRNDLMLLIKEQRSLGLGKNYIETLRSRIIEAYLSAGYTQTQVTAFPIERSGRQERHVTWVIDEGERAALESIDFDGGVVFTKSELESIFWEGLGGYLSIGVYVEKELDRAVEFFIQKLKSRGYLGARLLSLQTQWNSQHSQATVSIFFYEGEQTRVASIEILGGAEFPSHEVSRVLGVKVDEPMNLYAFTEGIQRLKSWYRNRGYLEVGIVGEGGDTLVKYRDENRVADIRIEIEPGSRFHAGDVSVDGLQKTRSDVVTRELAFRQGDLLTEANLLESESKLRRLGLFSTAQIRIEDDPERSGVKKIHVIVQEGTPGLIAGGVGFRNDLGVRVFGQTSYSNLFGKNHTVVFGVNANRRFIDRRVPLESQAQIGYIWPWFLIPEMTFRPSLTLQRTQYEKFDATSLVLGGALEKRLFRRPNLVASVSYNLERTEQNALDPTSIDNQTITIGGVTTSLKLDLRNDPLAPTRGFYSAVSYEIADPTFLSQREPFPIGYTRLQWRNDYLLPVWKDASWYFSFRTGIERNTQDITDIRVAIPLIKQFTLGGAGSLRGFKEQELNIQDIAVRGTASYVNYRAQLDLPLSGPMRFGPFLDAANLLVDEYSLGKNLRMGTGVGLHYLTPVGPVNFDLGFKVNPRPGEDPYRFYFSIGVI
ncbi:MAG: BamA/TamA family outer membrane protein [Bdellovibrionales bacterium]|nr:BamA/TamA family outer membrane protein [Bdellovibrionales bacterium]